MKLNEVQKKLLDEILSYKENHNGCAPSIRHLQKVCEISSSSVVYYHLQGLEAAGLIQMGGNRRHNDISVVGSSWQKPSWAA